jgi:hypothetical protein
MLLIIARPLPFRCGDGKDLAAQPAALAVLFP